MDSPDRDATALSLLDPGRRAALVTLADARGCDPADVLDAAVDAYLDTDLRQRAEIEAAVRDAEAGDFADDDEAAAAFAPR